MSFRGLERVPVDEAQAGDIISHRRPDRRDRRQHDLPTRRVTEPLHAQPIDPPTLSMRFAVNDSPDGGPRGHQGDVSRMIRDRLFREAEIERRDQGDREPPTRTASKSPAAASSSSAC